VLGDDAQPATSDGSRGRATSGPRHAAPRKSLLTKLHVPAGKAVALAAMPTAVLMGMGLTPHLAQADEPKTPSFAPGACVSQSDPPSPTASDKADKQTGKSDAKKTGKTSTTAKDTKAAKTAKDAPTTAGPHADDAAKPDPSAGPSGSGGGSAKAPKAEPSPSATAPTPSPSPKKSTNPLDPLGLGDVLSGLLGGKKSDPAPSPSASPTSSPTSAPTTSAPTKAASEPDAGSAASAGSGSGTSAGKKATDAVKGGTDAVKKAVNGLAGAAAKPKPSASPTAGSDAAKGSGDSDGKQGYPCPTYDAKALDDAQTEQGIPLLPDQPWTLKSSLLALHGLDYEGIVKVKTADGTVKDVLKFTTTGIDIGDLDQFVVGPGGKGHIEVKAAKGSTSTITGGTTTLYTESLSGNLLGLVPITFTPKAPPPLTLKELFFTNVTVVNAGQFGGNLHVPGMEVLPGRP
jgi:hypothetical protein